MGLGRVRRRSYKVQEAEEMRKSFLEEEEENSSVYVELCLLARCMCNSVC